MSHLFDVTRVKLLCSCGVTKPITAIYFCRYCLKLHCSNCVSHEVDTLYCPNCLENMPTTEARLKKNRCANCFDCPSCGHTLSVRAASVVIPNNEDPNASFSRKVYYLGCTGCRWTTRDIGMEDQTVATGGWNERTNSNYERIQELFEYYRAIAQKEKLENERKRASKKKSTILTFSDKLNLSSTFTSPLSRKSLSPNVSLKSDGNRATFEITPAEPVSDLDELPEEVFNQPVDLTTITTIEQRHAVPEWQPDLSVNLFPLHKHLLGKKSHRCRQCDHNLSKPEYNASSIKFKIQLGAYYHVPEVRIMKQVDLNWGKSSTLQLTLCNPTPHDMNVVLLPFDPDDYFEKEKESARRDQHHKSLRDDPLALNSKDIEKIKKSIESTAEVTLPKSEFTLSAKDDTAEYDETESFKVNEDETQVISWRKANKVGVNVKVTPNVGSKKVYFGLLLQYKYTNTVATTTDMRSVTLRVPVFINAGIAVE